jgi:serine/threonine protein kinase
MTLADCDLAHVLSLFAEERRAIIPDDNLRKAYGCLSFSLSHMHDMGTRHKDIKPQNVLVRNGSLLFTDFGTSKDYSELTNSLTVGGTNTRKYAAPEFTGDVNHQAPADVFALGLVLLSIWSVLEGWQEDEPENFSSIASSSPFCDNMAAMERWFSDRLDRRVQPPEPDLRNVYQRAWDLLVLKVLSHMILAQPEKRLRIVEVIAIFRHLSSEASFCTSCQIFVEDENHDTVDVNWILNFIDPATETAKKLEDVDVSAVDVLDGSTDSDSESVEIIHGLGREDEDKADETGVELQPDVKSEDHQVKQKEGSALPRHAADISPPTLQPQESAVPPLEPPLADSPMSEPNVSSPQQINFVDCFQRTFACPFHSIKTWKVRFQDSCYEE